MKIAICDDITEYRLSLRAYTSEFFKIRNIDNEIYEFNCGKSLSESDVCYDVLFLDIELEDMNGIEIAKEIKREHPNTIILIVTSYKQYLDDAMDLRVTRYIDKPLKQDRIYSALDKALNEINENIITLHMKDNRIIRIKQRDIVFAEAKLKRVVVHCLNENYCVKESMKQLRSMLSASCFAVPHNSYIVNLNFVGKFKRDEIGLIKPFSDQKISIATRKQCDFKRRFLDFIGEDCVNG